jgi:hypothetical protein
LRHQQNYTPELKNLRPFLLKVLLLIKFTAKLALLLLLKRGNQGCKFFLTFRSLVLYGFSTKAVEGGSAMFEIVFSIFFCQNELGTYFRVLNNRMIQEKLCAMRLPALEIFR